MLQKKVEEMMRELKILQTRHIAIDILCFRKKDKAILSFFFN